MTTKYTPRPWHITHPYTREVKGVDVTDKAVGICTSHFIAEIGWNDKEDEANAHLIAAAPELLEVCKIVTEQLRRIGAAIDDENPELSQNMLDALQDIEFNISEAEEAINKAKGK